MNLLKKYLTFAIAFILVLGCSSCGTSDSVENAEGKDESSDKVFTYSTEKGVITEYSPVSSPKEIKVDYVSDEYLKELDNLTEKRKQEILNTKTTIDLTGKTVYYISNEGDDLLNDGRSPESPFATVQRTEELLEYGDVVLFRRGDLFRGNFKARNGVTYSAYGEGDKPKMYASVLHGANPEDWTLFDAEHNIWRYNHKMIDIGGIIFNDGEAVAYKEVPTWSISEKKFVLRSDDTTDFILSEQLDEDLDFFCDAATVIEGGIPQVSKEGNIGYLYLRSDRGNPAELYETVEFNPRISGISIGGSNITIDNLCIKHAGVHGIAAGTTKNLTVTNCEIGWIGGGIQYYNSETGRVVRLGNGVEIYGGCNGYIVDNCYIYQCYDAGVTHQVNGENRYFEMYDIDYTNNVLLYNTYSVEYFLSKLEAGNKSKMKNVLIKDNIMRFSGYGWGEQRPDKGSAAHIKSWCASNAAEEFLIQDNIFDRALHRMYHIGAWNFESVPRLKGNTYIQEYGKNFGVYALYDGNDFLYDYNLPAMFLPSGIWNEEGAKVLFIESEVNKIEQPTPTLNEYVSYTKSYSYTSNDGFTVPFRMLTPPDYDRSKRYPVILYLGSEYQQGDDNTRQISSSNEIVSVVYDSWLTESPIEAIILAPQCSKDESFINADMANGNYSGDVEETPFIKAVGELLPLACEYFGGDSTNISVVGYSVGGAAVLDFAARYPHSVKNVVSIAAFANTDSLSKISAKKVYLYHGAKDNIVPVENARKIEKVLKEAGAEVFYKEFPRETHDCWSMVFSGQFVKELIG